MCFRYKQYIFYIQVPIYSSTYSIFYLKSDLCANIMFLVYSSMLTHRIRNKEYNKWRLIGKYPVLKDTVGIPFVSVCNYDVTLYCYKIPGLMEGGRR